MFWDPPLIYSLCIICIILLKTSYATVINMYIFCIGGKIETNLHLEQPFYLFTSTWTWLCVWSRSFWMSLNRVTH